MGLLNKIWTKIIRFYKPNNLDKNWVIKAYHGYANQHKIIVRGRVIRGKKIVHLDKDTLWNNLVNNIRVFTTDELKFAKILIRHNGQTYTTHTDDEGYFLHEIDNIDDINFNKSMHWGKVHLELDGYVDVKEVPIQTEALFILPHINAQHIIVSDLDDTILQSHVDSRFKLKMMYLTFFKNAKSRLPFEQMPSVLQQMSMNEVGHVVNPIFYLSNSPWNLRDMIHSFLDINKIPNGPLFLRDFGLHRGDNYTVYKNHKTNSIKHLLNFYHLPFILIGDATENDTQIYIEAFKTHPERIKAIFIRQSRKEKKNEVVRIHIQNNPDIPIVLFYRANDILTYCKSHNI